MKCVGVFLLISILVIDLNVIAMSIQENVKNAVEVAGTGNVKRDLGYKEHDENCDCGPNHEMHPNCEHKDADGMVKNTESKYDDSRKNKIPSHNKVHRNVRNDEKNHDSKKIRYLPEFVVMSRRMSIH